MTDPTATTPITVPAEVRGWLNNHQFAATVNGTVHQPDDDQATSLFRKLSAATPDPDGSAVIELAAAELDELYGLCVQMADNTAADQQFRRDVGSVMRAIEENDMRREEGS